MRNNIINVRKYENVRKIAQRNNKVDIVEKELVESKRLVKDIRTDVERVYLDHEKIQNKLSYRIKT